MVVRRPGVVDAVSVSIGPMGCGNGSGHLRHRIRLWIHIVRWK